MFDVVMQHILRLFRSVVMESRNYEKLVMIESIMDYVDIVILDAEVGDIAILHRQARNRLMFISSNNVDISLVQCHTFTTRDTKISCDYSEVLVSQISCVLLSMKAGKDSVNKESWITYSSEDMIKNI